MGLIFRNDDVNYNTNYEHLENIYGMINDYFPECEIWSCVTIFAEKCPGGSVYSNVPFKNMLTPFFYRADEIVDKLHRLPKSKVCSHGLYHIDHTKVSYDAQEMSILGSCNYLNTKVFVPPFNKFNKDTETICKDNGIQLIGLAYWKNFEKHSFTPSWERWYFHSWKYNTRAFKTRLLKLGTLTHLPS